MARYKFGGNFTVRGDTGVALENLPGTAWNAETGGTQYTDLLTKAGAATTTVITGPGGKGPVFQGPDRTPEVLELWMDYGSGVRFLLEAHDVDEQLAARVTVAEANAAQAIGVTSRVTDLETKTAGVTAVSLSTTQTQAQAAADLGALFDLTSVRDDGDVWTYQSGVGKFQSLAPTGGTGSVTLASLPGGSTFVVDYYKGGFGAAAGSYPAARPSTRTDLYAFVVGPNPGPSWLIAGDYRDIV